MTPEREESIPAWKLSYAKELECAKRAQIARLGLPVHAVNCPPTEQTMAMTAVQSTFTLLVLSGKPGTGKTVAATQWVLDYLQDDANWTEAGTAAALRSLPPLMVTAARLARWDRYEQEPMAKLLHAPRLVVDDLGAEYMDKNGFYASLLDEVINERYAGHRPTLLTTNLNDVEFAARYDQRIMGRIRETGRFFGCGTWDLRRRSA